MLPTNLICLDKASKYYKNGEVKALDNISLNISGGEYISVQGESGSGKSTFLNILGMLDHLSSGTFKFKGKSIDSYDHNQIAVLRNKEIGFIFQMFHLLREYSSLENVMLPLLYAGVDIKEAKLKSEEMIVQIGLKDRLNHKPGELSGGQQQRVAIARALVNNPSIILADEPTGNLDSKTSKEILELLEKVHSKGNTLVLITHETHIAKRARRVIKISDGAIEKDRLLDR